MKLQVNFRSVAGREEPDDQLLTYPREFDAAESEAERLKDTRVTQLLGQLRERRDETLAQLLPRDDDSYRPAANGTG